MQECARVAKFIAPCWQSTLYPGEMKPADVHSGRKTWNGFSDPTFVPSSRTIR
jgi:hypothetical protein